MEVFSWDNIENARAQKSRCFGSPRWKYLFSYFKSKSISREQRIRHIKSLHKNFLVNWRKVFVYLYIYPEFKVLQEIVCNFCIINTSCRFCHGNYDVICDYYTFLCSTLVLFQGNTTLLNVRNLENFYEKEIFEVPNNIYVNIYNEQTRQKQANFFHVW